jgi:hypothetical protein
MAITSGNTSIIPISSKSGIDGSTSIPTIGEGYCIDMENTDLSTANEIKKRAGYVRYCGSLPVKISNTGETYPATTDATFVEATALTNPETTTPCRWVKYNSSLLTIAGGGIAILNKQIGFMADQTENANYVVVELTGPIMGRFGMVEDHECYASNATGTAVLYRPIKILSSTIFIAEASRLPAATGAVMPITSKPSAPEFNRITNVVFDANTHIVTVYTDEVVSSEMIVYSPLLGPSSTITAISFGVSFSVTFAGAFHTTDIRKDFFKLYWNSSSVQRKDRATTGYAEAYSSASASLNSETRVGFTGTDKLIIYGTGVKTAPTALESFYSYSEQTNRVVAVVGGRGYLAPYPEIRTDKGPYVTAPPNVLVAHAFMPKVNNRYSINYIGTANAYVVGDTVTIRRESSSYDMLIVALDTDIIYVTGDVPTSITAGETLHWTRYTRKIILTTTSVIGADSVVLIDGISPHEVAYYEIATKTVMFDSPILFSSNSNIQLYGSWKGYYAAGVTGAIERFETFQRAYGDISAVKSAGRFTYGAYIADQTGVFRVDALRSAECTMAAPQILGIRSIPGSIGTFPIVIGGNNTKMGEAVGVSFTFVFYNADGFRAESEYSPLSDGWATPRAAISGADLSELLEYRVKYPTKYPSGYDLFLCAYLAQSTGEANSQTQYSLYKVIKLYPNGVIGVTTKPYTGTSAMSVLIGDVSVTSLSGAVLTDFTFKTVTTRPPIAKHMVSSESRLIAANLRSHPYIKVTPSKVFTNKKFSSFMSMTTLNNTALQYSAFFAPLGVVPNTEHLPLWGDAPIIKDNTEATATSTNRNTGVVTGNTYAVDNATPAYTVYGVDYKRSYCSVYGDDGAPVTPLTITYTDNSNRFSSVTWAAHASTTLAVLRKVQRNKDLSALPIPFESEVFQYTLASLNYFSSSKWTDSDLDAATNAVALNNTTFIACENWFDGMGELKNSPANLSAIFVTLTGGTVGDDVPGGVAIQSSRPAGNPTITMTIDVVTFPDATWNWGVAGDLVNGSYVVIHGIGTTISVTGAGDTILSWDKDLIWKATYSADMSVAGVKAVFLLSPHLVGSRTLATANAIDAAQFNPISVGSLKAETTSGTSTLIQIFKPKQGTGGATICNSTVALTGFSLPTDYIVVAQTGIGTGVFSALDQRAVIELSEFEGAGQIGSDLSRANSGNFPQLTDVSWVVSEVTNANSVKMKSLSTAMVSPAVMTSTLTLAAQSCIVNVTKLITVTGNKFKILINKYPSYPASIPGIATPLGVNDMPSGMGFLLIRGLSHQSACLELSGPIGNTGVVTLGAGGTTNYSAMEFELPYDAATSTYATIDYSKITGLRYSCYVRATDYTKIPIPVPRTMSSTATLQDLALPLYSQTENIGESILLQISKRLLEVFPQASINPEGSVATSKEMSANTCIIPFTKGDGTAITIYATSAFEIKGADSAKAPKTYTGQGVTTLVSPYPRQDNRGASLIWTDVVSATNVAAQSLPSFKEGNYLELNTEDDSDITGLTPFQNGCLIFKDNSIWRLTFNDSNVGTFQRIQSTVGSSSAFNLVSNLSQCYFTNNQGVFKTDGSTVEHILKLNRIYDNQVSKAGYLLRRSAGYVDMNKKVVHLGVPYVSKYTSPLNANDGEANYCFNDAVYGWNMNVGIDAVKWAEANGSYFFISARGDVHRVRDEQSLSRFRDGERPIIMNLKTRYVTAEDTNRFKFWRNLIFQFDDTTNYSFYTYYSSNYNSTEYPLEFYPRVKAASYKGIATYGTEHFMKILRETFAERVNSLSLRFYEGSIDTDAKIFGVFAEGWLGNTRLISQKATPGGERT